MAARRSRWVGGGGVSGGGEPVGCRGVGAKPVNSFQLYHHSLDMYSDLNKINKCIFIAAQNFRFTMHE